MFSNKNKKEKKENSVSTSGTHHVSQTSQNISIHTTFQQRSRSISYSSETQQQQVVPSSSITSLPGLSSNFLSPTSNVQKSNSSSLSNLGKYKTDAKPFAPATVNLNYQSPYRQSPVYSSYRGGTVSNRIPPSTVPAIREPPGILLTKATPTKKLVVKKTGKLYDNNCAIPTYKTSSKNRGEVLIINNIMFEGKAERKGARVDHERLEELFRQIGFKVNVKTDLKMERMKAEIASFSKKSSLKSADISVVVVMSHGMKNREQGGTEVFGIDDKGLLVDEILNNFSGNICKNMLDKPKIFIFQCCRGSNEQNVQTDARTIKPRPQADMLIAYSTLPGFVSYRDPAMGTWYIQTICDVFAQHAHEYHVEELLKIVDVELANLGSTNIQTSSYESRGFKRCYLHPK